MTTIVLLMLGLLALEMITSDGGAGHTQPPPNKFRCALAAVGKGLSFAMGQLRDGGAFLLSEAMLATHMVVLGRTGSGKSRFLNLFLRFKVAARQGFCLIDPHSDLAEDVLAYCARKLIETGDRSLLPRLHWLEVSFEMVFAYDPFRFVPPEGLHPELRAAARRAWLHAKADTLATIVQLNQGDASFDGMPRLQRVLRDLLIAVGTAVDDDGTHLPLADILVLLCVEHPRHHDVYDRVAPFLDPDVRGDFERLQSYRRVEDRLRETESSINRLRSLLSPLLMTVFADTRDAINFYDIIQQGDGIVLVALRKTPFFSHEQKKALGHLIRREIVTTMEITPRTKRKPFTLALEEVGEIAAGEDLISDLGSVRKHCLTLVLSGQDLSTLRRKDCDMAPKILSQCGTVVCFQQRWPDDLDILARVLGYGNVDFTPLENEVERHDHEWQQVNEWSEGINVQKNWGTNENTSTTDMVNDQEMTSDSKQRNWTLSESHQETHANASTTGNTHTSSVGSSASATPIVVDGHVKGMIPIIGTNQSESSGEQQTHSESIGEAHGASRSIGGSNGNSRGTSKGKAHAESRAEGRSDGGAQGASVTLSHKWVLVPKIIREKQKNGQLETSVSDQFERMKQQLHGLRNRRAVVLTPDMVQADVMETPEVKDPFVSPEAQARAIEWMKRQLRELHRYYRVPAFDPADQEKRLKEFLGNPAQAGPDVRPDAKTENQFGI